MKTRLCVHTVDGSIFRTEYDVEVFDNKEEIARTFRKMRDLAYMTLTIDGAERHFNPDNVISFWMEDME